MKKFTLFLFCAASLLVAESSSSTIPNISLTLLNGDETELYTLLEAGPVLIDFWATWCAPCKKEMIYLNRYHDKYIKDGFSVLAVNTDSPRSISKVKSYIRSRKYSFIVALDPNQQLAQQLNATLLPTSILVNQKGKIVWFHQGYIPGDEIEIEKQILSVLKRESIEDSTE